MMKDPRYTVRVLAKSPGVTAVIVISIAADSRQRGIVSDFWVPRAMAEEITP